jgi:geranylgeranyl pyrophosphate synthase
MAALGIFEEAREAVATYTEQARERLSALPDAPATEALHWLLTRMEARDH